MVVGFIVGVAATLLMQGAAKVLGKMLKIDSEPEGYQDEPLYRHGVKK